MIRGEENLSAWQVVRGSVAELVRRFVGQKAFSLGVIQIRIEANASQGDDEANVLQAIQLSIKESGAIDDFSRRRFVLRRRAADSGRNIGVGQDETVVAMFGRGLVGEASAVQHRVHEVAGGIAGERAPGAVRPMRSGGKPEDQDTRIWVTEARHGSGPVFAVHVGTPLFAADFLSKGDEARAKATGDYLCIEGFQGRGHKLILEHSGQSSVQVAGLTLSPLSSTIDICCIWQISVSYSDNEL